MNPTSAAPSGASAPVRSPRRPKTLFDRLAYGFGSVAYGVKDNGFNTLLLLYYNQVLGMPASQVGLALLIVLVIDAAVDPIIGYVSDNTRSRWGRRHPFMYASAIPVAISYLALWAPPGELSNGQLFAYLIVVASIVRVFLSFNEIPSTSLVADLSVDYDERTRFLSYRYFFGWWGGLVMSIVAFSVFLRPTAAFPTGQLNPVGYLHYGLVASVIMLIAILISALGTHRHIPSFALPPPKRPLNARRVAREVAETLWNRPFLVMSLAALFGYMAQGVNYAMLIYFRTFIWELSGDQISFLIFGNFASTVVALFLAPWLSGRLGKKRAAILIAGLVIVLSPMVYVLRLLGVMPPNGTDLLLGALFASSFVNTVLAITAGILTASMFADVVEHSELTTGCRSEGMFFSANSFVMQCVSGVGLFLTGIILDFAGFPEGAKPGQVPDPTLIRLMITELPVVAGLQLFALACLFAYPITRAHHRANLERLAKRDAGTPAGGAAGAERAGLPHAEPSSV